MLVCVSVAVATGACQTKSDPSTPSTLDSSSAERQDGQLEKQSGEYLLAVHWIDVYANFVVTINGFPARERWVKGRAVNNAFDVFLQTGLVDGANEVEVRLRPRIRHQGSELSLSGIEFRVEVFPSRRKEQPTAVIEEVQVDSAYSQWKSQVRKKWMAYLEGQPPEEAMDAVEAWMEKHPFTVSTRFDNEAGPDFSRVFEKAPRLEDTPSTRKRLKDYAMRLRDLMAEKDTLGLFREARPLFTDHGTGTPYEKDRILKIIATNWFVQDWRLDFTRAEVGLRRWSGGRVWELYKASTGNELFVAGEEKETGLLDIYVAELDGELRVVR